MAKNPVSVVVPTLNEQDNVTPLINRLANAFTASGIEYEIIFVDDHSTDATVERIAACPELVSVRVKQGLRGKATSLMEGFAHAKYDTIAMIDADLQYPPEAIPAMVAQLASHQADIVVADRKSPETSLLRRITSHTFRLIFGKLLWHLDVDVQSGLKVFRKVILDQVDLVPEGWTFDLDFLVQARDAGYTITGHDIVFAERATGNAKLHVLSATFQIGLEAIKLRLRHGRRANNHHPARPRPSWFRVSMPGKLALGLGSVAVIAGSVYALPAAADAIVAPAKAFVANTAAFVADTSDLAVKAAGFGPSNTPGPSSAPSATPTPTPTPSQQAQALVAASSPASTPLQTQTQAANTCTNPTYTHAMNASNRPNDYSLDAYYIGSATQIFPSTDALYVCSFNNWYVTANDPATADNTNVQTRAYVGKNLNDQAVSSFKTIPSSLAETAPLTGSYDFAYDIWLNNASAKTASHVYVWNDTLVRTPGGTDMGIVTIGGETYTVWKNNTDITFVADTNVTSGTIDLLSFITYATGQGLVPRTATIHSIDYGPDIAATTGTNAQFQINDFAIAAN